VTLALPYSARRRYLSGIDWSIGLLDHMTRRQTGVGNLSQIVLELEGFLPDQPLRGVLAQISARFPLIHGRAARDWLNLAPYWRVPAARRAREIPLRVVDLEPVDDAAAQRLVHEHVNTALSGPGEHLRFLLVHLGRERSRLAFVFDHQLLDAFGAEAFLQLIDLAWQGQLESVAARVKLTEPAHLDHWGRRFVSGRSINGYRLKLSERPVAALPLPPPQPARPYRFLHARIEADAAQRFSERVAGEIGAPVLLPAVAARAAAALAEPLAASSLSGTQHLMAVSVSARGTDRIWESLFFNHLSFLTFSVPVEAAGNVAESAPLLAAQLFEQMRLGIPGALHDAAMLMRICPHWLGRRLIRIPFGGRVCSFYLACLLDSAYTGRSFMGLLVNDLIHTPRVPPPPGVGLCLTAFGGRWNIVLSYLEGVLDDGDAAGVMNRFQALLNPEGQTGPAGS
jgi:hypothetical protein